MIQRQSVLELSCNRPTGTQTNSHDCSVVARSIGTIINLKWILADTGKHINIPVCLISYQTNKYTPFMYRCT